MNTSALIAELVIIGLQAMIWLSMIVTWISGYQWIDLDKLGKIAVPLAVVMVGVAYTLGIVIDAVTARLEDVLEGRGLPADSESERDKQRRLRQELRLRDDALSRSLDSEQHLLRLLRSTVLNLLLIFVFGSCLMWFTTNGLTLFEQMIYPFILLLVVGAAWYGWWRRREKFRENRKIFYKALESDKRSNSNHSQSHL
jgi:hypothetical protein